MTLGHVLLIWGALVVVGTIAAVSTQDPRRSGNRDKEERATLADLERRRRGAGEQ